MRKAAMGSIWICSPSCTDRVFSYPTRHGLDRRSNQFKIHLPLKSFRSVLAFPCQAPVTRIMILAMTTLSKLYTGLWHPSTFQVSTLFSVLRNIRIAHRPQPRMLFPVYLSSQIYGAGQPQFWTPMSFSTMSGWNLWLVADEPVEFEK